MNQYIGKSAVVLGGTHGMGLAMARALLRGGAKVLSTGNNEANLKAAQRELPEVHFLRSDAGNMADVKRLRAEVEAKLGAVDALFVNVGMCELGMIGDVTEESYDRHFQVNTKGTFFSVLQLLPLMRDGGGIVMTTVTPATAVAGMSVYMASKAALHSFSRSLAVELLPRKIRVNCVAPGFIETPTLGIASASEEERAGLRELGDRMIPMKRHGTSEEVAVSALFLAFGATYTTGVTLPLDGGISQLDATPA